MLLEKERAQAQKNKALAMEKEKQRLKVKGELQTPHKETVTDSECDMTITSIVE